MRVTAVELRRRGRSRAGRDYLIRPTTAADAAALVALRDAVAAEARWIAARPGDTSVLEELLGLVGLVGQGGLSLSLQVGTEVVGHLVVRRGGDQPPWGELALSLRRDVRGEGMGRALLETALAWAAAVGLQYLRLAVFPDNLPAISLYRAVGFVAEELCELRLRPGDDTRRTVLLMSLSLTPPRP